jgi:nucleoside phosphorylase
MTPTEELSIGFLTALVSDELISCEEMLSQAGWQRSPNEELEDAGITRWSKVIGGRPFFAHAMSVGGPGQVLSAVETIAFLARSKASICFLTGIAGSLQEEKIRKEDVVVATHYHWRTQNKIFGESDCDEYRPLHNSINQYDQDLLRRYLKFVAEKYPEEKRGKDFKVHAKNILTWDYVVNSRRVVQRLNSEFPLAACVEMEAGGFLSGVRRYSQLCREPTLGFVIKGISDYASSKDKEASVRKNASRNAAKVAIEIAEWMSEPPQFRSFLASGKGISLLPPAIPAHQAGPPG